MPHQRLPFLLIALLGLAACIGAQCAPQWQSGDPLPHVSGAVNATVTWDPDGAGPLPLQIVVGGSFQAGDMVSAHIAAFDGSQWLPLGEPGGTVTALAVFGGQLIAAIGSGFTGSIVRWTGSAWQPLGTFGQLSGSVTTFAIWNGELIAGGFFTVIDGVLANSVARWNGGSWSALGSGVNGRVHAFALWNNVLQVAGQFTSAGGVACSYHAIWNGSAWSAGAAFNAPVETLTTYIGIAVTNAYLFAGGSFTSLSAPGTGTISVPHVARLTASTNVWSALPSGLPGTSCKRLFAAASGLLSFQLFAATDNPTYPVWQWTGTTWTSIGYVTDVSGPVVPSTLSYYGGKPLLGLADADVSLRSYDSTLGWVPVRGRGIDGTVAAACAVGNDVVIAGSFVNISGVPMNGIARGAPGAWQPLGSGLQGGFGPFAVAAMPNGDIVAAGDFTSAGGTVVADIARWNGSSWQPLGTGLNDVAYALCVLPNGDLVAGGRFTLAGGVPCNRIARWNGATWSPLGSGSPSQINTLRLAANGDLLVGGNFTTIGGIAASRIARWNGSSWSALGGGVDSAVWAVAELPNGDVVVGGHFATAGGVASPYIARWNGGTWGPVGIPIFYRPISDVLTLAVLPDGALLAGGAEWSFSLSFPPVHVQSNLARLDEQNSNWSGLDVHGVVVNTCVTMRNGDLVVGGWFEQAGGLSLGNVARMVPPCPATATTFAPGCPSSGGNNLLTATTLPWVNSTFHATGTGLPTFAAVLAVTSVTAIVPPFALATVFPEAVPGCNLHVAPDIVEGLVTTNGIATSTLSLPNTPPLVGVTFCHQMVPIELGPLGQFVAMTSTNALQLTAGIF